MTKQDYFMHLDLPTYGKVGLIEGKWHHYFSAMFRCRGDNSQIIKYLILELLFIDDKPITEEFLNEMPLKDVCYLMCVIGTMMENKLI